VGGRCWIKYARTRKWPLKPPSSLLSSLSHIPFRRIFSFWNFLHIQPTFLFSLPLLLFIYSFIHFALSLPLLLSSSATKIWILGHQHLWSNGFGCRRRTELRFKILLRPQNHHRFPPPPLRQQQPPCHPPRFPLPPRRRAPQDPRLQTRTPPLHAPLKRRCVSPPRLFYFLRQN